jgi:hypothetical protein
MHFSGACITNMSEFEFSVHTGNDCRRALELARANVANRPTRRAVKQVQTIAVNIG